MLYIKKKSNDHVCGDEDPIWTAGTQNERLESGGEQIGSSREGKMVIAFFLPLLVLKLTPAILSNGPNGRSCAAYLRFAVDPAMIMHLQLVNGVPRRSRL